ncbi:MAG: outer membrane lipoprotein carrier protein LolA [Alphaproteobacteria bacterium]|nr:outer membrane lipoprotein carrier protein LolA [Alphaproteobacteria bacterium]MBL0717811.1 outer membrane lipoprotein carrier protein LolA [Alphaproteobacteria bacterium]
MKNSILCLLFCGYLILFCSPSQANIDNGIVKKVEKYFNEMTTLEGQFTQTIIKVNGQTFKDTGEFYFKTPAQMRFNYNSGLEIIASKSQLVMYQDKTDQITTIPLAMTPAKVLLQVPFYIIGNPKLMVLETGEDNRFLTASIALAQAQSLGSVKLFFDKNNRQLVKWIVKEPRQTTTISVSPTKIDGKISPKIFVLSRHKISTESSNIVDDSIDFDD